MIRARIIPIYRKSLYSRQYVFITDGKNFKSLQDRIIINKESIMRKIRENIRQSFISTKGITHTDQYFIGLVHTYPAWIKFFSLKDFKHNITQSFQSNSAHNPYGHTLVEFFHFKDNTLVTDIVMNVGTRSDPRDRKFRNFIPSSDYFLNNQTENDDKSFSDKKYSGNHQNGLLERSYITINIEVDKITWDMMQDSYQLFDKNPGYGGGTCDTKFSLLTHLITNKFPNIFKESGNCCYWTTRAFHDEGMLDRIYSFPMVAFYKFLINIVIRRGRYFNFYQPLYGAQNILTTDGFDRLNDYSITLYKGLNYDIFPQGSFLYPFSWLRSKLRNIHSKIWRVGNLANIEIELSPDLTDVVVVQKNKKDIQDKNRKIVNLLKNIL